VIGKAESAAGKVGTLFAQGGAACGQLTGPRC